MGTMTSALTPTETAWHDQICGTACKAPDQHASALALAAHTARHAAPNIRAARLHDAICDNCPAPHEHAARIAARITQ